MSLAFSHEVGRRAQVQRSQAIATILADAGRAIRAQVNHVIASWRASRRARATYQALSRLDDWTLRDLGMDRSELQSVSIEASTRIEFARVRAAHIKATLF